MMAGKDASAPSKSAAADREGGGRPDRRGRSPTYRLLRQREPSSSRSTWRSDSIVTGADSGAIAARKVALMRV